MRIKFEKGEQRRFFKDVLKKTNCPSLRELIRRGFGNSYSTFKNYFNESRTLPKSLFEDLCEYSGLDKQSFNINLLNDSWGQSKGGKISKK